MTACAHLLSILFLALPGETFTANGVKIRYFVEGQGEPVVLIHGLHASADLNWKLPGITSLLAKNHQVISLDLPGHGGSDKPDQEEAYGVAMAADVILLMDHLKIAKAHLVGYSMGGMVTLKMIVKHPERVLSGALCGMGWLKEGGPLQKFWNGMSARQSDAPSVCMRSLGKLAVTEAELKAVKIPVIMLVGDKDPVRQLYVDALRQARPDWTVIEIKDAGHISCIAKPQFKDELKKWLEKPKR